MTHPHPITERLLRRIELLKLAMRARHALHPSRWQEADPTYQRLLGALWALQWVEGLRGWPRRLTFRGTTDEKP